MDDDRVDESDETVDEILGGRLRIIQRKRGYRFSLDALLQLDEDAGAEGVVDGPHELDLVREAANAAVALGAGKKVPGAVSWNGGEKKVAAADDDDDARSDRGTPGNDLGSFMDGPKITVRGNAQDGCGNTMNNGIIVIMAGIPMPATKRPVINL